MAARAAGEALVRRARGGRNPVSRPCARGRPGQRDLAAGRGLVARSGTPEGACGMVRTVRLGGTDLGALLVQGLGPAVTAAAINSSQDFAMSTLDNSSILITGGTGSFGQRFVRRILAR